MKKQSLRYRMTAIAAVLAVLTGCGRTETPVGSESIELLDPIHASANTEKAAFRHLYEYETFMSVVYPKTETYAFGKDVTFDHFVRFPGESVAAGDILAYADNTALAQQTEQIEETLEELQDAYEADLKELLRRIEEKQILIDQKNEWAAIALGEADTIGQEVALLELELEGIYHEYESRQQLYELDYTYYAEKLAVLREEETQIAVTASAPGVIAAIGEYEKGDRIEEDTAVIAVADDSEKRIRCDYISQEELDEAARVYAVVNGERYEVEYIPYEAEEYRSIVLSGKAAESQFIIADPENKIEYGSLAVLTLIYEEMPDALSVPVSALHTDEEGVYVYGVKNDENRKVYVEEGFSDGVYTQIVGGIEEGDDILLPAYKAYGNQTLELKKEQFSGSFDGGGYIIYPDYEVVTYDIEYGEGQFVQYEVERYDTVQKGEPVATITVQGDDLLIEEKELRLQRMQERLMDLDEELKDPDAELTAGERENLYEQMVIAQENIAELSAEIEEIKADYETTQLFANADGIVIWINEKQEGEPLSAQENLVYIASPDTCYLQISNTTQVLNYGDRMQMHYIDGNGQEAVVQTEVLTVNTEALSGELRCEQAYLRLPEEVLSYLEQVEEQGGYHEQLRVTGTPRTVSGVILIPKKAVFVEAGQTYVYVRNADGTVTARSFIAGGYDVEYYWVVEGLEEGMTICWE